MPPWEDYFRRNTLAETRYLAKSLDREAAGDEEALRKEIGDKHADVLALTQRIESLRFLVTRQESDLATFASTPSKHVPREIAQWQVIGLGESHIVDLVSARLLSIIDRSIVQRKYVLAARALYLAESFGISTEQTSGVAQKLEKRLDAWLVRGTQVSQNMLHACMIVRRWSAEMFVTQFLAARLSQVRGVLAKDDDVVAAFKLIDSTLFIHHQLVSDLCKSRLSQRRLTELPEFSGQTLLLEQLRTHPVAGTLRAFPPECYETSGEPIGNSEFLDSAAQEVQAATSRLFSAMADVRALTSTLSKFVIQAQNSLSVESGLGKLLDACEPPFSARFEEYLQSGTRLAAEISAEAIDSWKRRIIDLRAEQAQIARLSRTSSTLAPVFSERLSALDSKTKDELEKKCGSVYTEERMRILGKPLESLDQAHDIVKTVALLDAAYASLGGTVGEPPKAQYEQLSKFIVERWKSEPLPEFHEPSISGQLFTLLAIMDSTLIDATWSPAILSALRPLVLAHVRETAPELVEPMEQALLDSSGVQAAAETEAPSTAARSRLFLHPLVQ